jgi:TPR repeat protein
VRKDRPRAIALIKRACDAGECERLDPTPLEEACAAGVAAACSTLGDIYHLGSGVTKDRARAAAFYARGCDGGDPEGCFDLADFHRYGFVEPVDGSRAALLAARGIALFEDACREGDADMCHALGQRYRQGSGVLRDPGRAAALFEQACDRGSILACEDLRRVAK